mgnify:CR=1 FL=1
MSEIKVLDKGFVRLVDTMGDDSSIVQAARTSYGNGTKKTSEDVGLIRYLMRHRHTTPLEFCQIKLHVKAPIFVIRQWHRHRAWSYNELSGRYSEMPNEYYVPAEKDVTRQSTTNKQGSSEELLTPFNLDNPDDWWDGVTPEQISEDWTWANIFKSEQEQNRDNYERYLKSGMRKELGRLNLSLSQYTEMYACVDLHNLFHFLKLRLDRHSQLEIRVYAEAIYKLVKEKFPIACEAFEDYILNSITLTSLEQKVLMETNQFIKLLPTATTEEEPLDERGILQREAGLVISNKRERQECIDKLTKLLF